MPNDDETKSPTLPLGPPDAIDAATVELAALRDELAQSKALADAELAARLELEGELRDLKRASRAAATPAAGLRTTEAIPGSGAGLTASPEAAGHILTRQMLIDAGVCAAGFDMFRRKLEGTPDAIEWTERQTLRLHQQNPTALRFLEARGLVPALEVGGIPSVAKRRQAAAEALRAQTDARTALMATMTRTSAPRRPAALAATVPPARAAGLGARRPHRTICSPEIIPTSRIRVAASAGRATGRHSAAAAVGVPVARVAVARSLVRRSETVPEREGAARRTLTVARTRTTPIRQPRKRATRDSLVAAQVAGRVDPEAVQQTRQGSPVWPVPLAQSDRLARC